MEQEARRYLAEISWEASQTQALEAVHFVLTAAAVQTRRAGALVHVPLTVLPGEAGRTHAPIAVYQVLRRRDNLGSTPKLLQKGGVQTITIKPGNKAKRTVLSQLCNYFNTFSWQWLNTIMFMVIQSTVVKKLVCPSLRKPCEPTFLRFNFRGIPQQFHCWFGENSLQQLFI